MAHARLARPQLEPAHDGPDAHAPRHVARLLAALQAVLEEAPIRHDAQRAQQREQPPHARHVRCLRARTHGLRERVCGRRGADCVHPVKQADGSGAALPRRAHAQHPAAAPLVRGPLLQLLQG
eukprot:2729565-Prymnesium_polylepis.2